METIKQLAIPVKQKKGEIISLREKLKQTRIDAQLPDPAKRTVERVPTSFVDNLAIHQDNLAIHQDHEPEPGKARTYIERTIEAAQSTDHLELLKEKRQKEIGLAHLENRSPDTSTLDADIRRIEGARAAISLLEERIVLAQTELAALEKPLAEACYAFGREKLEEAQAKYWAALDMVAESLPYISGAAQLMGFFGEKAGRPWRDHAAPFFGAPVRRSPDGSLYPVDWKSHTPMEPRQQAYRDLLAVLQDAGVSV